MTVFKAKVRIMVFGTFDVLHPGHLNFFKQARNLAAEPYLIVSVARDKNVQRIKGQKPLFNEQKRLTMVAKSTLVDKAVLGGVNDYLAHILKLRPKIIALGFDQTQYVGGLKAKLAKKGLPIKIFRMRPHKRHIYKSSLLKKKV